AGDGHAASADAKEFVPAAAAAALPPKKPLVRKFSELDESPEAHSSLLSLWFFWWLNPLVDLANRRTLDADDLFPIAKDDKVVRVPAGHGCVCLLWCCCLSELSCVGLLLVIYLRARRLPR